MSPIKQSLLLPLFLGTAAIAQPGPNILLINIDDLGWRDVGFMGSEYYETPNLDKLAARGMIFTNAYAAAANCAPSRASMMSGNWTLIQYFENNDLELYNLKEDVGEKNNLAVVNRAKTSELLAMLEKWRKDTNAPVPDKLNPGYNQK